MDQPNPQLPFQLDRNSGMPLTEQLALQISSACATGTFQVGQRLPGIREMALLLSVSEIVVRQAITRLAKDGIVVARRRTGIHIGDRKRPTWQGHVVSVHLNEGPYAIYRQRATQVVLSQADVRLTQHFCPDLENPIERQRLQLLLESQKVDMVALIGGATRFAQDVETWGLPHVCLGQAGNSAHPRSTLLHDVTQAWIALGTHLVASGAHRIAILPTQPALCQIATSLLVPGLRRLPQKSVKGISGGVIETVERRGFDEVRQLLQGTMPDALIFTDDWAARGGLLALAMSGIEYPKDLLFATHANSGFLPLGSCSLTRVEVDPFEHGKADAQHVLSALGLTRGTPVPTIGASLVVGESTCR